MNNLRIHCGFNSGLFVSCVGQGRERSRGLALMWNESINVTIASYSLNHICGSVEDEESGTPWSFSGIYGYPKEFNKQKTWELIKDIRACTNDKWICFGDLNDILADSEKKGGGATTK